MATAAAILPEAQAQIAGVIAALSDSWNRHDMASYGRSLLRTLISSM
jgi:hypothetical protein